MLLLEGELSGKPHTADVARAQWRRMRGGTGELLTGHHVTRITGGALAGQASRTASTTIHFSEIDDATIDRIFVRNVGEFLTLQPITP